MELVAWNRKHDENSKEEVKVDDADWEWNLPSYRLPVATHRGRASRNLSKELPPTSTLREKVPLLRTCNTIDYCHHVPFDYGSSQHPSSLQSAPAEIPRQSRRPHRPAPPPPTNSPNIPPPTQELPPAKPEGQSQKIEPEQNKNDQKTVMQKIGVWFSAVLGRKGLKGGTSKLSPKKSNGVPELKNSASLPIQQAPASGWIVSSSFDHEPMRRLPWRPANEIRRKEAALPHREPTAHHERKMKLAEEYVQKSCYDSNKYGSLRSTTV